MYGQVDDKVSGLQRGERPGEQAAGAPAGERSARPTLVRLRSAKARVPDGEPLTLDAQVSRIEGSGPAPTGVVEFRVGAALVGCAAVDATGGAALDGVHLAAGVHALTATYLGDAHHEAATSAPLPQAVAMHLAPVVLLVTAPSRVAEGIQLGAELVDPRTGRIAEAASGSVVFSTDDVTIVSVDLVGGHARAVVPDLPTGCLEAHFAGDAEHAPASGSAFGPRS